MDCVIGRSRSWDAAHDGCVPASVFREGLGRFGSGVTVLSVAHGDGYHAMTANAFMSISLDPPLIAVSVGRKARMNEHLREGARLGINVLSQTQQAVALHFGGRPDPALQFDVEWEQGVPVLAGSAGTLVAEVERIHEAGDHRIFIAQLTRLNWSDEAPLLFWGGRFGRFLPRASALAPPPLTPDFWC